MHRKLRHLFLLFFCLVGPSLHLCGEGIHLIGDFRFSRIGDEIRYEIDEIQNSYDAFFNDAVFSIQYGSDESQDFFAPFRFFTPFHVGDAVISLGIWATPEPYSHGPLSGFNLVEVNMGVLEGGIEYYDVVSQSSITEPPFGNYNVAMVLSQWMGAAFEVIDVINLRWQHTFGSPFALKYEEAEYLGRGWKSVPWVGIFNDEHFPWIHHREHGWMYISEDTPETSWIWSADMGWCWTSVELYPFLFRTEDSSWLWYREGSRSPRLFFNLGARVWEER